MIKRLLLVALVAFVSGCMSSGPQRTEGCDVLDLLQFDGRLYQKRVTQDAAGCLVEGLAPSSKVANLQLKWIESQTEDACGRPSHTLYLRPATRGELSGYEFAAALDKAAQGRVCEPMAGSIDSDRAVTIQQMTRSVIYRDPPNYPRQAVRRGIEGTTVLLLLVEPDGQVGAVLLKASSGSKALDEAAIAAARRWRFTPAQAAGDKAGRALIATVPIRFQLE